jgi:hypothetical protein
MTDPGDGFWADRGGHSDSRPLSHVKIGTPKMSSAQCDACIKSVRRPLNPNDAIEYYPNRHLFK